MKSRKPLFCYSRAVSSAWESTYHSQGNLGIVLIGTDLLLLPTGTINNTLTARNTREDGLIAFAPKSLRQGKKMLRNFKSDHVLTSSGRINLSSLFLVGYFSVWNHSLLCLFLCHRSISIWLPKSALLLKAPQHALSGGENAKYGVCLIHLQREACSFLWQLSITTATRIIDEVCFPSLASCD